MIAKWMKQLLSMVVCATLLVAGAPAEALQEQPASPPVPAAQDSSSVAPTTPTVALQTTEQLDALVAPIALYPDALVAQICGRQCRSAPPAAA